MLQTKKRLKLMSACLVILMLLSQTAYVMAVNPTDESSMTEPATLASETQPTEGSLPPEGSLPTEETLSTEETLPTEGSLPPEETLPTEESLPPEETLPTEGSLPPEETLLTEGSLPPEETLPTEEPLPTEGSLPPEEPLPAEEALLDDVNKELPLMGLMSAPAILQADLPPPPPPPSNITSLMFIKNWSGFNETYPLDERSVTIQVRDKSASNPMAVVRQTTLVYPEDEVIWQNLPLYNDMEVMANYHIYEMPNIYFEPSVPIVTESFIDEIDTEPSQNSLDWVIKNPSFVITRTTTNPFFVIWTLNYLPVAEQQDFIDNVIATAKALDVFKQPLISLEGTTDPIYWISGPNITYDAFPGIDDKGLITINMVFDPDGAVSPSSSLVYQGQSTWTHFAVGTYSTKKIEITNTYIEKGSFTPLVTKALSGRTLADDEFEFELWEGDELLQSKWNLADGSIPFDPIEFSVADIGTHTFTIIEKPSGLPGVTDDPLEVEYRVEVERAVGAINLKVISPEDDEFNNIYEASGSFAPHVSKVLSGRALAADDFEFVLREGATTLQLETNSADGSIPFEAILYTLADVGEHSYTITENPSGLGGVTDDDLLVTYVVTVTDNGDGTLDVSYDIPADTEFNNVYTAHGSFTPVVTKVLTGRTLAADEFELELKEGATVLQTKTNAADGSIPFETIHYTEAHIGEHSYTISEKASGLGGVTDDVLVVTFVVTVSDNGDGTLVADFVLPADTVFNNTYTTEDSSLVLEATKTLTGAKPLEDQEFSFELYKGAELVATAKNSADGKVAFAPLVFGQIDIGVHNYTVKEVNSGLEGVTYDAREFPVEVTVVDNGDGTLTATANYPEGEIIHFVNDFTPLPITHNPVVEKLVTGKGAPADAKFHFELKAITPDAPMPAGAVNASKTYTITGAGNFELGLMSFAKEGTYVYELREQPTDAKNFTIDTTLYTITIKITREGYKLVKSVVLTKNNGTEAQAKLAYTNSYKAPPPPIPRTGEQGRNLLYYALGLLAAGTSLFLYKKRRNQK